MIVAGGAGGPAAGLRQRAGGGRLPGVRRLALAGGAGVRAGGRGGGGPRPRVARESGLRHLKRARASQDALVGHFRSLIGGFRELKAQPPPPRGVPGRAPRAGRGRGPRPQHRRAGDVLRWPAGGASSRSSGSSASCCSPCRRCTTRAATCWPARCWWCCTSCRRWTCVQAGCRSLGRARVVAAQDRGARPVAVGRGPRRRPRRDGRSARLPRGAGAVGRLVRLPARVRPRRLRARAGRPDAPPRGDASSWSAATAAARRRW